ncbi:hypothetical protein [Hutsoniella sourekii]|uniref:hypothetical protein n=1 Tax=Hutsoniella sourekii TaxID=87650 RepID=UPI0012EDF520|nr:hypothetical protein [Hutsoniella sourekii]
MMNPTLSRYQLFISPVLKQHGVSSYQLSVCYLGRSLCILVELKHNEYLSSSECHQIEAEINSLINSYQYNGLGRPFKIQVLNSIDRCVLVTDQTLQKAIGQDVYLTYIQDYSSHLPNQGKLLDADFDHLLIASEWNNKRMIVRVPRELVGELRAPLINPISA